MVKQLVLLIGLLSLIACAHHRDVRAGASGIHRVVVQAEDTREGSRDAIKQANHFCKEVRKGRTAAFVKEKARYTGDVDESTYKTGKKVSKAAQILGSAAHIFGGKTEKGLGGAVGLGGVLGDTVLGDGYTVDMKFKCI